MPCHAVKCNKIQSNVMKERKRDPVEHWQLVILKQFPMFARLFLRVSPASTQFWLIKKKLRVRQPASQWHLSMFPGVRIVNSTQQCSTWLLLTLLPIQFNYIWFDCSQSPLIIDHLQSTVWNECSSALHLIIVGHCQVIDTGSIIIIEL